MATLTAKQKALKEADALGLLVEETETLVQIQAKIDAKKAETAGTVGGVNGPGNTFIVDQAWIDAHPNEVAANDIKLGDEIAEDEEDTPDTAAPVPAAKPTAPGAPLSGDMDIIRNGNEYVRTFKADQQDSINEFLGKYPDCAAVPTESITGLYVPYDKTDAITGVIDHTQMNFTDKAAAILFKNEQRSTVLVIGAVSTLEV